MKLLFVHDVKALIYNDEVYARSYGRNIWERYLKVFDEITVCARCKPASENQIRGIDKITGDNVHFDSRIGMFKGPDAFFSRHIHHVLRENIMKHDGVIVRLDSFMGLIAISECKKLNKPYLIECVGCAWDSFWNHGIEGKILAPFIFYQMKKAIKDAPFVVYVTKEFLQRRYPTLGLNTNISNVSLPTFEDGILNARLKRIDSIQTKEKHLATVANVGVRYKGFQYVIQALGIIKKQTGECDYIYHIIGEGDQSFLKQQARRVNVTDNIVFHGAVKHEDIFNLMKEEIDIYIQPSLQEGLPRAMIEAMSCALPCIGTDVAGIPELIQPEYIYQRSGNMPKQIVALLNNFNIDNMKSSAQYNFTNSKNYSSDVLTNRRTDFLIKYKSSL